MKKILFLTGILAVLSGCNNTGNEQQNVSGEALGTTYSINYFSEEDIALEEALDSIFRVVNKSMSTYLPESDISRINRGDSLVKVDTLFRNVFNLSQQVNTESGGYFDPTVGDLVNIYGFGPEKNLKVVDSAAVDSLMLFVGLNKISISPEGQVKKAFPEVYLDFNAIAKGYTIDLIGHYLNSRNVDNFLVELGGELLAKGENLRKNSAWTVGIDDPNQEEGVRTLTAGVQLVNRAMATSGNYRKFRRDPETGTVYVHTINPLTGYPEKSNLLSVSVLAENCALADAYATAFMALGMERSVEVLETLENVDVYLIFDEQGTTKKFASEGFREVLVDL
ncbi:FAD:protein FMN transferase [Salinimicrobium sp. GXAS 041]|uniref:FAD:protein FMN transferase n=1 Tax=Salinimicrobium sp. GXAS 041 TaxID=3400806 RepID=UPI003C738D61